MSKKQGNPPTLWCQDLLKNPGPFFLNLYHLAVRHPSWTYQCHRSLLSTLLHPFLLADLAFLLSMDLAVASVEFGGKDVEGTTPPKNKRLNTFSQFTCSNNQKFQTGWRIIETTDKHVGPWNYRCDSGRKVSAPWFYAKDAVSWKADSALFAVGPVVYFYKLGKMSASTPTLFFTSVAPLAKHAKHQDYKEKHDHTQNSKLLVHRPSSQTIFYLIYVPIYLSIS